MSEYIIIPERTENDLNSSADINQLMTNIKTISGNGTLAPDKTIQELLAYIIELQSWPQSDSNEHGNYIKHRDGTLICFWRCNTEDIESKSGSPYQLNLTFPHEFIDLPIVNPSRWTVSTGATGFSSADSEPHVLGLTTEGFIWCIHDTGSSFGEAYTAIGRWKE